MDQDSALILLSMYEYVFSNKSLPVGFDRLLPGLRRNLEISRGFANQIAAATGVRPSPILLVNAGLFAAVDQPASNLAVMNRAIANLLKIRKHLETGLPLSRLSANGAELIMPRYRC